MLRIMGKGMFLWWGGGLKVYYRLLGAQIGKDVKIHPSCNIGEYDLLCIKDGACLDADVLLRPMCLDRGTLTLKQIKIGPFSLNLSLFSSFFLLFFYLYFLLFGIASPLRSRGERCIQNSDCSRKQHSLADLLWPSLLLL